MNATRSATGSPPPRDAARVALFGTVQSPTTRRAHAVARALSLAVSDDVAPTPPPRMPEFETMMLSELQHRQLAAIAASRERGRSDEDAPSALGRLAADVLSPPPTFPDEDSGRQSTASPSPVGILALHGMGGGDSPLAASIVAGRADTASQPVAGDTPLKARIVREGGVNGRPAPSARARASRAPVAANASLAAKLESSAALRYGPATRHVPVDDSPIRVVPVMLPPPKTSAASAQSNASASIRRQSDESPQPRHQPRKGPAATADLKPAETTAELLARLRRSANAAQTLARRPTPPPAEPSFPREASRREASSGISTAETLAFALDAPRASAPPALPESGAAAQPQRVHVQIFDTPGNLRAAYLTALRARGAAPLAPSVCRSCHTALVTDLNRPDCAVSFCDHCGARLH
jgi:hypothetical protein